MNPLTLSPPNTTSDSASKSRSGQMQTRWTYRTCRWAYRTCLWGAAILLVALPAFAQPQESFPDETVAQLLTAALYQYFDPSSRFEVSASGSHLGGDFLTVDDLLISGKPAVLHGLRGEVLTHLSALEIDLAALTSQTLKVHRVREATVVAKITAAAVQDAISRLSTSVLNPQIRFEEGAFTVTATIRREGKLYPMQAIGSLVVVQAQRVHVALSDVIVAGGSVPMDLVDKELARINPIVDMAKWPIPLHIQRLVLHKDTIEMLAVNAK